VRLDKLRLRFSALAKQAIADRDQADVIRNALLRRQADQLQHRAGTSARLVAVRNDIDALERRQAIAAAAARRAATATDEAPPTDTPSAPSSGGGGGPSNVSGTVARVVAAANQIASTPYVWGGGHGGSASGGYDCSGSVSYALAAGGLLSSPLDSTGFMSWGAPGPGAHITVYANAGHAFMIVDGRRFDTSALSGGGTRWTSAGRSTAGFVARHPPGY
jgi:cell wall-associated NlpC family hydrolase